MTNIVTHINIKKQSKNGTIPLGEKDTPIQYLWEWKILQFLHREIY